jgi:hypothetical protein
MIRLRQKRNLFFGSALILLLLLSVGFVPVYQTGVGAPPTRRVNIPYLGAAPPVDNFTPAIFWFGSVTPANNYADVRAWYYDDYLKITVHVIDRLLWYDTDPSMPELEQWDAVSLYLDVDEAAEIAPDATSYRFVIQLNQWQSGDGWQAAYRGDGAGWTSAPLTFTAERSWRGAGLNDTVDDKGWVATFVIPFSTVGLATPPRWHTRGRLAVVVHDRDSASGTAIPEQTWPANMQPDVPATWGEMMFGLTYHVRPPAVPADVVTVRHGQNGAVVADAHVGGHGNCADGLDHWSEWGEANYAGYTQINIQNQWDVSDYPCFSKYYVTFPLPAPPTGQVIMAASLTMNLFGNAGGGEYGLPPDSFIQVLTVGNDWHENSISWNNAPLAAENIGGAWVKPVQTAPAGPYQWDVALAVAAAYRSGDPLRLALYSADGERHTGKYFWSSDTGDWNAAARPTLRIQWGHPIEGYENWPRHYLPLLRR